MEILENYNQIEEIDNKKLVYIHGIIAEEYLDEVFTNVIRNMKYKIPAMEEFYESAY